ncbi:MAG: hypothetical protein Q9163_000588 [Psora crenata]
MVADGNDPNPIRWRDRSSSSSLKGMETPWPSRSSTPESTRVESIIDMYMEKPLPSTPGYPPLSPNHLRSASVVIPQSPVVRIGEEVLPSELFRKGPLKRSSASQVPDKLALRPYQGKDVRLYSEDSLMRESSNLSSLLGRSQSPLMRFTEIHPGTRVRTPDPSAEPHFTEWEASVYRAPEKEIPPAPRRPSKPFHDRNWETSEHNASSQLKVGNEANHGSRHQAEDYRSLIYGLPLQSPGSCSDSVDSDSEYESSQTSPIQGLEWPNAMSSRISDVLNQPIAPEIMDSNSNGLGVRRISGGSSADPENIYRPFQNHRDSITREEHPFRRRPSSKYHKEGVDPQFTASTKEPKQSSRRLSGLKPQPKSIQQGVSDAYASFHHKISSPSKTQPQAKIEIPRVFRNPAIPMTAYQQYGTKAWESPKGLSKLVQVRRKSWLDSSPETSHKSIEDLQSGKQSSKAKLGFSMAPRMTPQSSSKKNASMGKKLASTFQNGTAQLEHAIRPNKEKVKQAKKNEERREQLKRKIVVVLPEGRAKF